MVKIPLFFIRKQLSLLDSSCPHFDDHGIDDSFARIVDPSYNIREGGSEFTRLYIDIARGT